MYIMHCCVLIVFSVFTFASSATEDHKLNIFELAEVRVRSHAERHDGEKRQKRFISTYDETDITTTINSLRASVGASNMNYMSYNSSVEADAANWTSYCDYDAIVYSNTDAYVIKGDQDSIQIDHVAALKQIFSSPTFYYGLSSVYLQYVGAGETFCSSARVKGQIVTDVYLVAYLFTYTSNFNKSYQQYMLGEPCTTCLSGSYWCYEGLCKGDCSSSDSNCYCNSYCLNCATTDGTTCMCQCLSGWAGPRCQNNTNANATAPMCSTTPRLTTSTIAQTTLTTPWMLTTPTIAQTTLTTPRMLTTPTIAQTTLRSTQVKDTSGSVMNMFPIGKSMFQLVFYATIGLFFRQ